MTATPKPPLVERVARALWEAEGGVPDALEPIKLVTRNMLPPDAFDEEGRGCHFYWRRHIGKARAALDACGAEEMLAALNEIAAWHDGETVGGRFDEPGSAQIARDALAKLDVKPSGGAV